MSEKKKCETCWGHGIWAIGHPAPMDAGGGMPTKACPECGANANPVGGKREHG